MIPPHDKAYLNESLTCLKPPPDLDIIEWCEKNINLPELTCPEPGPFKVSRTPYVKGPLKAFTSLYIEHINLIWGRQLAKTTNIFNCITYGIAQDPGPALFLFPNEKMAKSISSERIQPHILGCQSARAKKTDNPDDFAKLEMKFKDMILSIGWAGSETQAMSRPARYLMIDEIDAIKKTVGEGKTSPVKSAYDTTSNFGNRKIIFTSTPSEDTNYIWQDLLTCQLVFEYWIPCPHCGTMQIMTWEQIKWPKGERDPIKVSSLAWYECPHCCGHIRDRDKSGMLAAGEWRARNIPRAAEAILRNEPIDIENTILLDDILDDPTIKKVGFHLPQWYSPFPNATFGIIAKEFLESQGDYVKMRDWTKFKKALPWVEKAQLKQYHELFQNRIDLLPCICPADTIALTCTLDPGQGGFWYTVLAHRIDTSCHLVEDGFLPSWDQVSIKCFQSTYEVDGQDGARLPIWRIGIDTGGSKYEDEDMTMTEQAYQWLRSVQRNNVFGIKGDASPQSGSRLRLSMIDKMPGAKGQIIPGGIALWLVNSSAFKDAVHFRLAVKPGDPGRLTFHNGITERMINHILAEEKQRNSKGQWEWVRKRPRNDLFVCLAYGLAMGDSECLGGVRVLRPPQYKPKPQSQDEGGHGKGWLTGIEKLRM